MSMLLNQMVAASLESGQYTLPMLPESSERLISILRKEDIDFREVEDLISEEPALAARILCVANHAMFRGERNIASLQQAVVRLGARQVLRIVFSEQISAVFDVPGFEVLARANWWRARLSSLYAAALAQEVGEDPDTAFICGLLHSVGSSVVLQVVVHVADELDEVLSARSVEGWVEAWYTPVGERLAKIWGLPEVVQTAIRYHLSPMSAPDHSRMVQITAIASLLARCTPTTDAAWRQLGLHPAAVALGLDELRLQQLSDALMPEMLAA